MHLKAIKLRGFKSFVDPVEIRLEPGVAVVVGPNGSGKSNVSDSILWATGSMSPGELRAEKPDDVLFAGSAGADELEVVASRPGRKVRDNSLERELRAAVAGTDRTVTVHVHETKPEVTTTDVAQRYPSYLTLDRGSFTLRLWEDLELTRTYTVAVGQEGLETPEGLYEIQAKEENPIWHVPESDWAGDLAGQTIPPGPSNPIKARWMAIYEGAGIHGTEETASLGSAASHGCVRMAIADVEELYDQVEVGTPIFIG